MFERFRRSGRTGEGSVATGERGSERAAERQANEQELRAESPRTDDDPRFGRRETPGERDRGIVVDEPHSTSRGGTVENEDGTARDRDDMDDRDRMHRDDDIRARDDRRDDAGDRPLSREAAIEDERMAARRDVADDRAMRDDGEHRDNRGTGRAAAGGAAAGAGAMAGARAMRDDDRDTEHRRTTADDRTMRHERDTENRALRDRDIERDRVGDGDADPASRRHAPVLATEELATMRERQRDRFGGFQWGADFFGWLCAMGLASMLTAILVGAGVALGLSTTDATNAAADANSAQTIGLGGGIALLVVLAIAWFSGGYVAGRMARFDGARQGIGVWLWTILAAIIVAALAAIGGTEYDVFQRLNLPRIAIGGDTLTAGGAITGAVAIIVTLLFAVIGGKVGERFHKRVDRVATDEFVVDR
jgi:hypothetical protein